MEKYIHNHIIEGIHDGDTIKELLQENNLTLTTAIAKCYSKEVTNRHCSDIVDPGSESWRLTAAN